MKRFKPDEIQIMKRMLNYPSIDFPILSIDLVRSLIEKGAIEGSELYFFFRLTAKFATMAGVVSERLTPDGPLRWIPRSEAIRIRLEREGRIVRQRTINECDLTYRYRGRHSLVNVPDHRRNIPMIGVSATWNGKHFKTCPICHGKFIGVYCLKCDNAR